MIGDVPVRPPPGSPDDPGRPRERAPAVLASVPVATPSVAFAEPGLRMTVVPLGHPVMIEGERLDEVEVHRLTGRELFDLVMQGGEEASLGRRVRARMTRMPVGAIDELDVDDAHAVMSAIEPFLPAVIRSLEGSTADSGEAAPSAGQV